MAGPPSSQVETTCSQWPPRGTSSLMTEKSFKGLNRLPNQTHPLLYNLRVHLWWVCQSTYVSYPRACLGLGAAFYGFSLGMKARLSKVPLDFFYTVVTGDDVLSIVDLLLSSRRDTFICLQVGEHCRHQLLHINFPMIFSLFQSDL